MSRLNIFSPPLDDPAAPVVLPFLLAVGHRGHTRHLQRTGDSQQRSVGRAVHRARALNANRTCRFCQHPQVEPIELADPQYGRGNLPIPGTASLVGFRCHRCHSEWPNADWPN